MNNSNNGNHLLQIRYKSIDRFSFVVIDYRKESYVLLKHSKEPFLINVFHVNSSVDDFWLETNIVEQERELLKDDLSLDEWDVTRATLHPLLVYNLKIYGFLDRKSIINDLVDRMYSKYLTDKVRARVNPLKGRKKEWSGLSFWVKKKLREGLVLRKFWTYYNRLVQDVPYDKIQIFKRMFYVLGPVHQRDIALVLYSQKFHSDFKSCFDEVLTSNGVSYYLFDIARKMYNTPIRQRHKIKVLKNWRTYYFTRSSQSTDKFLDEIPTRIATFFIYKKALEKLRSVKKLSTDRVELIFRLMLYYNNSMTFGDTIIRDMLELTRDDLKKLVYLTRKSGVGKGANIKGRRGLGILYKHMINVGNVKQFEGKVQALAKI